MSESRRIDAVLEDAVALRGPGGCAVRLVFRPLRGAAGPVEGLADLGPEPSLASIRGEASVRRVLRAARRSAPAKLLGRAEEAARLLASARGARVRLEVRPRVRLRFTAWTESGVEVVDDVEDVIEDAGGFLVRRLGGRLPVRLPRERVVRRRTTRETWLEITAIRRG